MTWSKFIALRIWHMIVIPALAFAALAYATEDKALILVLNIVLVSSSVSVFITFTPEVWQVLINRVPMDRTSWLAFGIWLGWGSVAYRGVETLIWRLLGQPLWLANSDFTSAYLWMGIIGAISHIVRPGAINSHLPRGEMIRVGVIIGFAVAVGLSIVYAQEICAAWKGTKLSWVPPGIERAVAGPPPDREDVDTPPDILHDLTRDADRRSERIETTVTPSIKDRVEQYRIANGLRSIAEAARRLVRQGLDDDDKSAIQAYRPRK